jgi:hypothetical protein
MKQASSVHRIGPLNEYEQEQKELRKNLERLKAERLASEAGRAASVIPLSPVGGRFRFLCL